MDVEGVGYIAFFLALLPLAAFLYASVGHGGASAYLALMALFSFPASFMKPAALLMNIVVSGISFWFFYRRGHFRRDLFLPFAISSIPMAFAGGYIQLDPFWYKQILGLLLLFAVMRILGLFGREKEENRPLRLGYALLAGGLIGLLSGMIGIGGGIILSPLILLLGWGNFKETAAVSALFILVNSLAGITGMLADGQSIPSQSYLFILFALPGALAGAYMGSSRLRIYHLRYILSLVLLLAGVKLLIL